MTTEFLVFEAIISNRTYCYVFEEFSQSNLHGVCWETARIRCQSLGGDLLSIQSKEEQDLMDHLVTTDTTSGWRYYWIGLIGLKREGRFFWSDGSNSSFGNWYKNLSKNFKWGKDSCAQISATKGDQNGKWKIRETCLTRRSFICKIKGKDEIESLSSKSTTFHISSLFVSLLFSFIVLILNLSHLLDKDFIIFSGCTNQNPQARNKYII